MASPPATVARVRSIDFVRGLVCVLMAIDHVRVYAGIPAGGDAAHFLTRWVTHFVAPAFAFFAGTGMFLASAAGYRHVPRLLVTRGLLLVLLELTLIRFLWSFNPNLVQFKLAGVIWMLGWCMVLLAVPIAMGLSARVIGWIGVAIVASQQVFGMLARALPSAVRPLWAFIYPSGADAPLDFQVLYVIVPWIGVMAAGYGFGLLLQRDDRRRTLVRLGLAMTIAFVVIATIIAVMSGTGPGEGGGGARALPLWIRVLGQQKYPASQLFLLMTLGPAIAILPWAERAHGRLADAFVTFGRVPLFYYLLHIPAIHLAAIIVNEIRGGVTGSAWYMTAPYASVPRDHAWTLGWLYLVWAIVVAGVLYPACRWYAQVKATRPRPWMRYV